MDTPSPGALLAQTLRDAYERGYQAAAGKWAQEVSAISTELIALSEQAVRLAEQLAAIVTNVEAELQESAEQEKLEPTAPIEKLDLMVRPYNCLKREGLHTIADVICHTEEQLAAICHSEHSLAKFIRAAVEDIKTKLAAHGYEPRAAE